MSKTKLHETIKKYRVLAKQHKESWNPNIGTRTEKEMQIASYDYQHEGCKLFHQFIEDLEGLEVFDKKN